MEYYIVCHISCQQHCKYVLQIFNLFDVYYLPVLTYIGSDEEKLKTLLFTVVIML